MERSSPLQDSVQVALRARKRLEHPLSLRGEDAFRTVPPDALDELGQPQESVRAERRVGRVPCIAERRHPGRQRRLLTHREGHDDPAVGELETHSPALVDRVVTRNVRALVHEPDEADLVVTRLLVGLTDEDDVAARLEVRARERNEGDRTGRGLVLHVGRASSPDEAFVVQIA
jgi:hypothetical protein